MTGGDNKWCIDMKKGDVTMLEDDMLMTSLDDEVMEYDLNTSSE